MVLNHAPIPCQFLSCEMLQGIDCSERHLGGNFQAERFEGHEFSRMIRENPHRSDVESGKNLCANAVLTLLAMKANRLVGVGSMLTVIFEQSCGGSRPAHL